MDSKDTRDYVWGWRRFLSSGGGLIDYCAASDDLVADVQRLEEQDFGVDGPEDGGRRLPDDREIRWLIARIHQEGRLLPFLIEDLSSRELRFAHGPFAEHPNGAAAIYRLEVVTPDVERATRAFAAFTGSAGSSRTSLRLGPCTLSLVTPEQGNEARDRIDASGPGPFAVGLVGDVPGRTEELDRSLSHGVSMRILERVIGS